LTAASDEAAAVLDAALAARGLTDNCLAMKDEVKAP
jgi:hypothetical protein